MGSGKVIQYAIKKNGIENFTKIILEQFDDSTAMYDREKELITEDFLLKENVYNLRRGGFGGFEYINKHCGNQGKRLNLSLTNEKRKLGAQTYNQKAKALKKGVFSDDYVSPFKKNDIQKNLQNRARIKNLGTIFINNNLINKRIKKDSPIPEGWYKGRIRIKK